MSRRYGVIGLGSFGMGLARELARLGARVIAVDNERAHVEAIRDEVHTALLMDARDRPALEDRRLHEVDIAVICMGEDFEAAEICAVHLADLGCPRILVRGTSRERVQILTALGAEVITPGLNAAQDLAVHLVSDALVDHASVAGHHVALARVPASAWSKLLGDLDLEERYGVRILALRRGERLDSTILVGPPHAHALQEGDHLLLTGPPEDLVRAGAGLSD